MPALPFELIANILSHLPRENLYECMKVCRLWYSEAAPRFYRNLVWRNSANEELLELVKKPLIDGKKIGDYAKKISFRMVVPYEPYFLKRHEFAEMIDNLSKLEVIFANGIYADYLCDIPAYKLTQVQEITPYNIVLNGNLEPANIHYLLNKRLRDQITTLKISFNDVVVDVGHDAIMRDLSKFTHLKKLLILSLEDPHVVDQEHIITSVLNTCHSLTRLAIRTDWKWTMNRAVIVIHTNLISLELQIRDLDPAHLECIMHCAPNLKKFRFLANHRFYQEMSSMEDPSRQLSFLKKLECLEILIYATFPESTQSAPFFWDFWTNLCGNSCSCDMDAIIVDYSWNKRYRTKFVKEHQHLKVDCFISLNVMWTNRMNFLTFNSIRLSNEQGKMECVDYHDYLGFMKPILCLLEQQQQVCAIYIKCGFQVIYFDSVPLESASLFERTRKRADISYGYICGFELKNQMLDYSSTLYPSIQNLELKTCMTVQEYDERNILNIDFTQFKKLQQLTCDFDSVVTQCKSIPRLFIQSIGMSNVSKNFYYDKNSLPNFTYIGKQNEIDNPSNIPTVKIHHADSTQLVVKRSAHVGF